MRDELAGGSGSPSEDGNGYSVTSKLSVRLSRLLNMVPYFLARPGISPSEAAAELGVSTRQLMSDLNQLWLCGLPGYGPGDLIDLSFSEKSVEVTFSAGMDRPLRLTSIEATALVVALRSVADLPGMADPTAAHSAIAKLETALSRGPARSGEHQPARSGEHGTGANPDAFAPAEAPGVATVRSALAGGHAVRLVYYSASRDVVSERVVDPIRIVLVDDRSYLQAWCREAEGVRLFRFDRIEAATELPEPVQIPTDTAHDAGLDLFREVSRLPEAQVLIRPDHAWVLEVYTMEQISRDPEGWITATMRYATQEWMVRVLLGFGSAVTALAPPELVAGVRERAAAALAAYAESGLDTEPGSV